MQITDCSAYEVLQKERIEDVHADGYLLRHKKSGARVMLLANDDENKCLIYFPDTACRQHRCRTYPGTQCAVRIPSVPVERSFCGTGQGFPEYIFKCDDLPG